MTDHLKTKGISGLSCTFAVLQSHSALFFLSQEPKDLALGFGHSSHLGGAGKYPISNRLGCCVDWGRSESPSCFRPGQMDLLDLKSSRERLTGPHYISAPPLARRARAPPSGPINPPLPPPYSWLTPHEGGAGGASQDA